jgi:hypothetical protein
MGGRGRPLFKHESHTTRRQRPAMASLPLGDTLVIPDPDLDAPETPEFVPAVFSSPESSAERPPEKRKRLPLSALKPMECAINEFKSCPNSRMCLHKEIVLRRLFLNAAEQLMFGGVSFDGLTKWLERNLSANIIKRDKARFKGALTRYGQSK